MQFKVGDTIEFTRNKMKQRGSVIQIEDENVIINLFAAEAPHGIWLYMGVYNESKISLKEIEEPIVVLKGLT